MKRLNEQKSRSRRFRENAVSKMIDNLYSKAESSGVLNEVKDMPFDDACDAIMDFVIESCPNGDNELWSSLTNILINMNLIVRTM